MKVYTVLVARGARLVCALSAASRLIKRERKAGNISFDSVTGVWLWVGR